MPQLTITSVVPVVPYVLQLTFADGKVYQVDLQDILDRYPSLAALKDPELFTSAAVGEWGSSITWNESDGLELAGDNLRALAVEQAGGCSHEQMQKWMAQHSLTLASGAEALGLSRRMLAYYRSGEKLIPRTVALAMLGWEQE